MYCVHCGSGNPDYARFCVNCGCATERTPDLTDGELQSSRDPDVQGMEKLSSPCVPEVELLQPLAAPEIEDQRNFMPAVADFAKPADVVELSAPGQSIDGPEQTIAPSTNSVAFDRITYNVYASLGERFVAYIADLVVIYLIVAGLYFASGLLGVFGKGFLSAAASEETAIVWVTLFVYMITSLSLCHTTVGKYVLGLEVASEGSTCSYPPFWKILLRETIGRVCSSFFFGVGYWRVPSSPKKQAWSDEISGTVVKHRDVNSSLKWALTAFVAIGFVLDIGLIAYGSQVKDREKNHAAWEHEISTISVELQAARTTENEIISRDPKDLQDWQANMRQLLPALGAYDTKLDEFHRCLQRGDQENLFASDDERRQTRILDQVTELRKQQNAILRHEADLVLNYYPRMSGHRDLQSQLRLLDSDISSLDHKASEMLADIGIK